MDAVYTTEALSTGAGRDGRAVAFCAPAEVGELRAIEKAMKAAIPVIGGEPPVGPVPSARPQGGRGPGMGKPMGAGGNKRPARRPSRAPKSRQA